MVDLSTSDRQRLVRLLADLPEMASEQARRQVLELAGLKQLVARIDLAGAPLIAASQIVGNLERYGRVSSDREALGVLLNLVKSLTGLEQQEFLDELLTSYDMMTPIAMSPRLGDWRGGDSVAQVEEKIIGENSLRPIAFLAQALLVARAVAFIGVQTAAARWTGTGFLVAPDLVMTNHHVLNDEKLLTGTVFRFNFEDDFHGRAQPPKEYRARAGGIFHTNGQLDYSIVELDGTPGAIWGWLPMQPQTIRPSDRVNIVQHPGGQPKQVALQNNFVEYVGGHVLQYVTSTLPGSSGSPVFDDRWDVLAVHHAGGSVEEPTTHRRYYRNEGILVTSILADLSADLRRRLDETAAHST
jgi:V8-like Glu-specific endopeptidase